MNAWNYPPLNKTHLNYPWDQAVDKLNYGFSPFLMKELQFLSFGAPEAVEHAGLKPNHAEQSILTGLPSLIGPQEGNYYDSPDNHHQYVVPYQQSTNLCNHSIPLQQQKNCFY